MDAFGPVAASQAGCAAVSAERQAGRGTAPPVIDLVATSNRATASLKGTIRDGMYVGTVPFKARILVTQRLGGEVHQGAASAGDL